MNFCNDQEGMFLSFSKSIKTLLKSHSQLFLLDSRPQPFIFYHSTRMLVQSRSPRHKSVLLFRRGTLSAGSHSCSTSKAMIIGTYTDINQFLKRFKVKDCSTTPVNAIYTNGIAQLLIEITVINLGKRERKGAVQHEKYDLRFWKHSIAAYLLFRPNQRI